MLSDVIYFIKDMFTILQSYHVTLHMQKSKFAQIVYTLSISDQTNY